MPNELPRPTRTATAQMMNSAQVEQLLATVPHADGKERHELAAQLSKVAAKAEGAQLPPL